jgi:hypothetical protein
MAFGLRGGNDRSMAIRVIAAARVFVCSNLAFSGGDGSVVLRKKYTSRLDLAGIVPSAVDAFLEKAGAFRADLDRMWDFGLSDARAKEVIYDAFTGPAPVSRSGSCRPSRGSTSTTRGRGPSSIQGASGR